MCQLPRIQVLLPILIRTRQREIQIKRPPLRNSRAHCRPGNKLRSHSEVVPGEDSVVGPPTEAELGEATQKVPRRHQPESTIPKAKNKKVPQKILRMKRVQLCPVQIRISKARIRKVKQRESEEAQCLLHLYQGIPRAIKYLREKLTKLAPLRPSAVIIKRAKSWKPIQLLHNVQI